MPPRESLLRIATPAWKFFLPLTVAAIALGYFVPAAGVVVGILALYILFFFRDPRRVTPNIPGSFVAPADGRVVSVREVPCDKMFDGRARVVSIFLSIFNVHVQRASYGGRVLEVIRRPGRFMNALNDKCSEDNEQVLLWVESAECVYGIKQIAGAIARRIVCQVKEGDALERGERYGLIQFGSRVELYLPTDVTVKVKPGDTVRGGLTCIGVVEEENVRRGRPLTTTTTKKVLQSVAL